MGDVLADGMAWLEDKRQQHLTGTVVFRRGADQVSLSATIGRTVFRVDKGYGLSERTEARDFIVRTEDLVLNATLVTPKAGDQVLEPVSDKYHIYELMAPEGEPCWRYSDPYRLAIRMHTKLVGVEVIP